MDQRNANDLPAQTADLPLGTYVSTGSLPPGDRVQELDVRFSRIFRLRGTQLTGNFDVYNLFNSSTLLNQNTRYGPTWQAPIQIMGGRLLKFGFQMNF